MPAEFDATQAGQDLRVLVQATAASIDRPQLAAERAPLFRVAGDGSVYYTDGKLLRGPVAPLALKGK